MLLKNVRRCSSCYFHLHPDSPALKKGFKPIPMEKIGLQEDECWAHRKGAEDAEQAGT
jgi:hypothetical protein